MIQIARLITIGSDIQVVLRLFTTTIWVCSVGITDRRELWRWHTHQDLWRLVLEYSILKFCLSNVKSWNVGITDGTDLSMPLRAKVKRYTECVIMRVHILIISIEKTDSRVQFSLSKSYVQYLFYPAHNWVHKLVSGNLDTWWHCMTSKRSSG
jgi:hypothetical protein